MINPTLTDYQITNLRRLAADPGGLVEPATLSKLRKLGLVMRRTETRWEGSRAHTKTTSPLTEAGIALLATLPPRI